MAQPASGWKPDFVDQELGVHIGLRHEDYLKDSGHGYGSIVDLLVNPVEWWDASPWNPLRKAEGPRKAFQFGEAAHVFFLEGEKVYNRFYGIEPSPRTHPDHLYGAEALRDACRENQLSTTGTMEDTSARLEAIGIPTMIGAWKRFRESGKKPVPADIDDRIRMVHRMAMRTPEDMHLADGELLTLKDALRGGLSEVSIFWIDEDGVRHRARLDYLKPNVSIDLKTITEWKRADFRKSLLEECILRGYVIQGVHYDEARRQLRKAVAEGRIFGGNKKQRALLERIARAEEWGWVWIFAKMEGAPQVKGIVLDKLGGQYKKAERQRNTAIANFVYFRSLYGMDAHWFDREVVWEPAEDDWPTFSVLPE